MHLTCGRRSFCPFFFRAFLKTRYSDFSRKCCVDDSTPQPCFQRVSPSMGVSLALLMLLLPVSSLTPSDVAGHSAHWLSSASAIRIAATVNDRGEVISDALRLRGGADAPPDAPPTERTYAMLKPDVASDVETVRKIKAMIVDAGFTIVREESALLTEQQCAQFYAEHAERSFFRELTGFMSSGPVLKLELEAPDAIKRWRALIGPTNSHKAREEAPATIRALFGKDGQENAAHGSDAPEAAAREIALMFGQP